MPSSIQKLPGAYRGEEEWAFVLLLSTISMCVSDIKVMFV